MNGKRKLILEWQSQISRAIQRKVPKEQGNKQVMELQSRMEAKA